MLDNAALEAAHGSTFQPPLIDGKPATATYRITYDFAP
jgi:outer membrane biosynthesis protein TonB